MRVLKKLFPYLVLCALMAVGISYRYSHAAFNDPRLERAVSASTVTNGKVKPIQFVGKIISDPEDKGTYLKYPVEILRISGIDPQNLDSAHDLAASPPSIILLKDATQDIAHPVRFGDTIQFSGIPEKPSSIESDDGRVFDYAHYLSKDDIFFIVKSHDIRVVGNAKSFLEKTEYALYEIKRAFISNIEKLLPAPHSFLGEGLVISGKGSLDQDLQTQFQRVGLIHIVVLSGFNISIVGEAIIRTFAFLPKIIGGVVGALGIILFGMMTGGGATVWRSVIMAIIGIYARLSDRKNSAIISLFIAGSIMLIITPKLLSNDPSFQLSFMATFGLILFASPFESRLRKICRIDRLKATTRSGELLISLLSSLVSLVSSTTATQIFTLPMIVNFSGVVSIVALPVNIIVLPLIPPTMLFVFLSGVVSFITPAVAVLPAFVSWVLLSYELWIVRVSSDLPFAALKLPPISASSFVGMYVALFAFAFVLHFDSINRYFSSGPADSPAVFSKTNATPV